MSYYRAAQPYSDSQYELQGFHGDDYHQRADTYDSVHSRTPAVSQTPVKPLRGGRSSRVKWIGIGCVALRLPCFIIVLAPYKTQADSKPPLSLLFIFPSSLSPLLLCTRLTKIES